ncbi:MAG: MurT ligase domain-containing protein [Deltaproteobacteria bacterium]
MKRLKIILAIIVGKLLIRLSRLLGNQGSNFPGSLALKIYPDLLREMAARTRREIIVVTGTNGKTTTSNMIASILREQGYSVIHNRAGANMLPGITTAFIGQNNILGLKEFDYALLETDEATIPALLREVKPGIMLITNFFRDQLDRYGELDRIIKVINDALKDQIIKLILNGDDPLAVCFKSAGAISTSYFGFEPTSYDVIDANESREGRYCVCCGKELDYHRYHYAQLGEYSCPQCGNRNPEVHFKGIDLELTDKITMRVNELFLESPYKGFYNAYNILAAVAVAKSLGMSDEAVRKAIHDYRPRAGRMEEFNIEGKRVVLILVKNPTGLNQSLSAVKEDTNQKSVFFALNDNAADGRDISWIWDADLEILYGDDNNIRRVVCSGIRSGDIAVRFKYAGIDPSIIEIESDLETGICTGLDCSVPVTYILSTYTALFDCRKILLKLQKQSGLVPFKQAVRG